MNQRHFQSSVGCGLYRTAIAEAAGRSSKDLSKGIDLLKAVAELPEESRDKLLAWAKGVTP